VNQLVQEETQTWINEFQTSLRQIDEAAQAKAAGSELGRLNVVVQNGDRGDDGGSLSIDRGQKKN
jgi:hypothetical protein